MFSVVLIDIQKVPYLQILKHKANPALFKSNLPEHVSVLFHKWALNKHRNVILNLDLFVSVLIVTFCLPMLKFSKTRSCFS